MALSRRSRMPPSIWPGFVDAMTALVLVLFFVISIFMIVQFVLRDTISGQTKELDELSLQVANLADALGLERTRADRGDALVATLQSAQTEAQARIAGLTGEKAAADAKITDFEAQVARLVAQNTELQGAADASDAAARLAEAKRAALEALAASLQKDVEAAKGATAADAQKLSDAEASRLAEAAAAEELRKRLQASDAELTAMTLSLEAERKKAEDTLTLLAAAQAAQAGLKGQTSKALTDAQKRMAELAQANALLAEQKQISAEGQRQVALLNQQTAELRAQLASIQGLLDASAAKDASSQVQIETLGSSLNAALAKLAISDAREKARLEAEAKDLANYRSEFFGQMRKILGEREGVQVVGDRFVFPSEVLFAPGSATLNDEGRAQIARVATVIREVSDQIPPDIPWILRVDGHTDTTPVSPGSPFRDNWELSEARALSVVRYIAEEQGLPPDRLAATGFGEYQPIDPGTTPEALARNRRIELKLTER
ncbi:MAG: peptidoglycan -binding protein [Amaricoccus sp.]|uniref:peptidoglycan -binding protein n=1 Tax=Amaricoccus sp. TaxID=1872485 RepID=UPI0039E5BFC7